MKKHRNSFLLLLVAALAILAASCQKDDTSYSFEIKVPTDWGYQYYSDLTVKYYAWSPSRLADDQAGVRDSLSEDLLISQYALTTADLFSFYSNYVYPMFDQQLNYQALSTVDTTINGYECIKHTHFQTNRIAWQGSTDTIEFDAQIVKYVFYHNNIGYIVDCTALPYTFDYYAPVFEDIMSTFKFRD